MGDPQQQQDLSHLVPVDQDGAVSTPPQSHAEAAPLDKPQPSEDSAQDLSKLQPVEGSQRDVQPDLSKLQPVEGTEKQVNPNVRTGGHAVSPSGVVRDDYGTAAKGDANPHDALSQATGLSPAEGGFHGWLQDIQADVRNGTDNTWFGAALKKMGSKGTGYGVSEGVQGFEESANPIAALPQGLAKLTEGGIEFLRSSKEVAKNLAAGDDFRTAVIKATVENPNLVKQAEIGANKVVGGAFQAAGPVTAALAPEATLVSAPVITAGMVAQHVGMKTALAMGMDPDDAEMVGNVLAIGTSHVVNAKINPLTKRFGAAVSDRTAAEAEYNNRTRNLETARGQQVQAQSDALAAAQKESATHADPKATPEQKKTATDATVAARQNANDAAGNVTDAQKAHDIATKNRADSIVQLEGLHRQIQTIADKENDKFDDQFNTEAGKSKDLFKKAVPSKGAHQYSDEDYDVWRSYMERAKKAGVKVNNFEDAWGATEAQRQSIETSLDAAIEKGKLKDNPITTNPFMDVQNGLADAAKIEPGILDEAADEMSKYNLKDLTVDEARETIKRLNSQNRSMMKEKNNWDVNDMMTKDPRFAARYLAAQSLREGFYGALKDAGVEGAEEARKEEVSLIKMREAIGAQMRANRGGVTVRGSGEQSRLRNLIARATGKAIEGVAIAKGASVGGPEGAIAGSVVGKAIGEPVEDFISPRDKTRDEHIQKSLEMRGTLRQPTKIKGIEGAAPSRPGFEMPPEVAEQMPTAVARVPRENTELHAELAAHYLDANGEYTYQQLEDRLRKDVSVKAANDPASVTPAEKTLLAKVIKLDKADAAAIEKANETRPVTKPSDASTADQQKDIKKVQAEAAVKSGKPAAGIEINPVLAALGRGDESGLVSESPAMKAHAKPLEIKGLEDGVNSDDVHREEWAHAALAAVDGLQPLEIRSDLHPKASEGAAATTAIAADQIKDEDGKYNPEMLKHQLVQWTTHKMAGPASHEIFRGATREELMSGNTHAADFREARSLVREVYPDWSAKQVNDYVNSAYDRAYNFLTKQHIADRIRANASVRETGLPETLHASRGRLNQFAEDIRKAHNDAEGNDAGPDGGGAGEGSEKPAQKPESGAAGREGAERDRQAASGKKKNEGRDSGASEEGPRGDDGKGSNARGGVESAEVVSKSGKGYTPSEKAETMSGERKDYGPEFDAAQHQHQIDLYKSIARNPKATPEEKTFARERLFDLQNPELREITSAANKKNLLSDESGNPLTVYHGTPHNFDKFEIREGKNSTVFGSEPVQRHGVYFSDNPDVAAEFKGQNGSVKKANLESSKVADFTDRKKMDTLFDELETKGINRRFLEYGPSTWEKFDGEDGKAMTDALKGLGYDTVKFEEPSFAKGKKASTAYIALHPEKIHPVGEGEETSNALRKSQIPPERTTGDTARDEAIKAGGGIPGGAMGDISMFHSPQTGSTLALKHGDITPERVQSHIASSDATFGPEQKIAPEETSNANKNKFKNGVATGWLLKNGEHEPLKGREEHWQAARRLGLTNRPDAMGDNALSQAFDNGHVRVIGGEGNPEYEAGENNPETRKLIADSIRSNPQISTTAAEFREPYSYSGSMPPEKLLSHLKDGATRKNVRDVEGAIDREESSQARKKSGEVLADIQRSYGVHDDPKVERSAGFITPDARYIDLPVDHTQAIEEHGGGKAGGAKDNRQDFINDTGAIRVHKARERAGNVLAFSVPKDGVTPAQVEAMQKSFGANGDRNGVLRIERADISPETRNKLSTEQEFPTASQVKPMLEKIDGLREETSNANKKSDAQELAGKDDQFIATPKGEASSQGVNKNRSLLLNDGSVLSAAAVHGEKGPFSTEITTHEDLVNHFGQKALHDKNAIRIAGPDMFEIMGRPSEAQMSEMARLVKDSGEKEVHWDFHSGEGMNDPNYENTMEHLRGEFIDSGKGSVGAFKRAVDEAYPKEETSNANKGEKNDVARGADEFNAEHGREAVVPGTTHSPEVAKRIADAYDAMKHDPTNPAVKASYDAAKRDIQDQWDYARNKMGIKMEPWDKEGQPYANSKEMMKDVNDNKHLSFFRGGDIPADHPLAETDKDGLTYNDKLRAVHDLFGHAAQENQFGPKGEENAWNEHRQMFSPEALPAITSETRGQNSWVNYGKHLRDAEGNIPAKGQEGYVPPTERPFAEQKAGILPEEFHQPNGVEETSNANKSEDPILKHFYESKFNEPRIERPKDEVFGVYKKGVLAPDDFKHTSAWMLPDGNTWAQDSEMHSMEDVEGEIPNNSVAITRGSDKDGIHVRFHGKPTEGQISEIARLAKDSSNPEINYDFNRELGQLTPEDGGAGSVGQMRRDLEKFYTPEETSNANRSPKGSSVPLMKQPLDVEGTGEKGKVSTLDVAKALNEYSQEKNPALKHDEAEPKAMTDRAKKLAEDEAKYQLAQGRTGKEWYTEEMKDHDKTLLGMRPELAEGPSIDGVPGHTAKLSLFKAAEAVLSSGQKPYGNFKSAVNAWDAYQKTGEFPRLNPATGKSWGPRGEAAYGNALDMINQLVKEKGEKGAADWLLSNHPVSELKQYNPEGVAGKKTDEVPGAMILGAKRGPFMQNLHGLESAFTADMWVARSWNRWMGTIETGKNADGVEEIKSDSPRNGAERDLMKKSFSETADKLGLSTSSLQAVLWYYEQGLYRAHGVPKESWSFSDAAKRAAAEEKAPVQKGLFDSFGGAKAPETKTPGAVHALDFLNALRAGKK